MGFTVFGIVVTLSLIVGTALAYPYIPGDQDEDSAPVYDERPEYVQYFPVRRYRRAAVHLPIRVRPRPRENIVLIPEGIQMRGGGEHLQQRADLVPAMSNKEPITAETGYGHSSHPYDYVDYGAYTGGYGAFGWYSDHPVHTYH